MEVGGVGGGKSMTKRRAVVHGALAVVLAVWAPPASGQEARPKDTNPQQAPFEMPDTTGIRLVLENGLSVFVIEDHTAPIVSFTAFVRGGTGDNEVPGAAEMLAFMMATRGPCWMAPGRFRKTLDDMKADFVVTMNAEMTEVNLNVSPADAARAVRIFSGIVREPCVDAQGLADFRAAVAASRHDDATGRYEGSIDTAVDLFYDQLYGDHPYGREVTVDDVAGLELDDVEQFHEDYFNPWNVTIAVAGDFAGREMMRSVDQRFADWTARRPPMFRRAAELEAVPTQRQVFTFPTDSAGTWLVIGQGLPPMDPADWPALELMNYILAGGHSGTRLSRELGDRRGLTNDIVGVVDLNLRGPGAYTVRAACRPDVAQQVIDVVLREIERIRAEPVTPEELSAAQEALANRGFARRFENGHVTARTFAEEWARFGTFVHLASYQRRVRSVSIRDVQEAALEYLAPDRMIVVILGPASA
jgi:zinc protease